MYEFKARRNVFIVMTKTNTTYHYAYCLRTSKIQSNKMSTRLIEQQYAFTKTHVSRNEMIYHQAGYYRKTYTYRIPSYTKVKKNGEENRRNGKRL